MGICICFGYSPPSFYSGTKNHFGFLHLCLAVQLQSILPHSCYYQYFFMKAFCTNQKILQLKYIHKILAHADRGYLTMNSGRAGTAAVAGDNKLSLEELRELLPPFEVIEEEPYTSPQNYIIIWGHR